jgi:hypothetical protein
MDLDRLNFAGSGRMIAAHPDNRNTALLAYLASRRKVRTGYPRYQPVFGTQGPGEKPLLGRTLYTHYGRGASVYTAFFRSRELPAGVSGPFRILANLLSAGKTL